jgi:hypothetical protein
MYEKIDLPRLSSCGDSKTERKTALVKEKTEENHEDIWLKPGFY